MDAKGKAGIEARSPIGRAAPPETIAGAILSLISGSDVVRGHAMPVDDRTIIGQG